MYYLIEAISIDSYHTFSKITLDERHSYVFNNTRFTLLDKSTKKKLVVDNYNELLNYARKKELIGVVRTSHIRYGVLCVISKYSIKLEDYVSLPKVVSFMNEVNSIALISGLNYKPVKGSNHIVETEEGIYKDWLILYKGLIDRNLAGVDYVYLICNNATFRLEINQKVITFLTKLVTLGD